MTDGQAFSKIRQALGAILAGRLEFNIDMVPLRFDGLSRRKALNWLLTESSVYFRPARPWGMPTIVQVEPTSRCNLRCVGCPISRGLGRPHDSLDMATFTSLVDDLTGYCLAMLFWDWGEPFLNTDAYGMIRYAVDAGIKVISSTNGQLFAKGDHAGQVVESGLNALIFSVDGVSQESYERFRVNGKLELALEGIRRVVAEKKWLKSPTPLVNLRFVVMKHNEHEIPELDGFARSLGVDLLTLRRFRDWFGAEEYVATETGHQLPSTSDGAGAQRLARNPCKHLWNCPAIHSDGTVCSCYVDYEGVRPLGSLKTESFRRIWHGERYRHLRRDFRARWKELPLCGTCSYGWKGGDIGRYGNVEAVRYDQCEPGQ